MESSGNSLIEALIARGYRITRARKQIAALLVRMKTPSTIKELALRVPDVDEVSVYRTIELFEREGLITRVHGHSENRFEVLSEHHHHLVCTDCGRTEHVPCSGMHGDVVPQGFKKILRHEVTAYGLCTGCA